MIKTLALSLVTILTIGSLSAADDAAAGGLQRGGAPGGLLRSGGPGGLHRGGGPGAPIFKRHFDGVHGARRHGDFFGVPWIAAAPYDTPPAEIRVNNNYELVAPAAPVPSRRVCRSEVRVVPAEAGGEREVTLTRCFLE